MDRKTVFLRDDDVYEINTAFTAIFDFCLAQEIPLVYGVIPGKAQSNLVKLLNKTKTRYPHLIDIVQHGWQHKNHNPDLMHKYEFGPLRSYSSQKRDIEKGLTTMQKLFGKNFTPAFIPPYHGYDANTLKIIRECNFKIFSGGKKVFPQKSNILDLPARFSLNTYTKTGKPLCHDALTLIKKLPPYLSGADEVLGMVFHHYVLNSHSKVSQMRQFFLFLKKLSREGHIRLALFSTQ